MRVGHACAEKHFNSCVCLDGALLDRACPAARTVLDKPSIPWAQYFDGKGCKTSLPPNTASTASPRTFLLDRQGKIIGQDLRGEALEQALAKALAEKP